MRTVNKLILVLCLGFGLVACNKPAPNTLVIGTIAGPETELMETAKEIAEEKYGLTVKIVEFNDYNLPNEALKDGSLDANVYQHLPYLKASSRAHGYDFQVIGRTFVYPMGIYSKKYKQLNQLPAKAVIAIPNDPSNETRALFLLQKAGLITLKKSNLGVLQDIEKNPKQFEFKEMDASQLPRILPDVDAAVINTTFAFPAGLSSSKDALYSENKDSPYANVIVIRRDSTKKAQLKEFVQALNSDEVKQKAKVIFGDSAMPAW